MTKAFLNVPRGQLPRDFANAKAAGDEIGNIDEFTCRWLLRVYLKALRRDEVEPHGLAAAAVVWREISSDDLIANRDLGGMDYFEYLCARIAETYDDTVGVTSPRPAVNEIGF